MPYGPVRIATAKFKKVVRKGYYKKDVVERVPTDDCDDELTDAATQTDDTSEVSKVDACTQMDMEVLPSKCCIEMQTDSEVDMEVEPIVDYVVCEGNNDERFQPLIVKDPTGNISDKYVHRVHVLITKVCMCACLYCI